MQALEFHFNPKIKLGLLFDSFCYEPSNVYEKRLGGLYMTGVMKSVLPQNAKFLDHLAKTIKDKYYKNASLSPEKSLRESLRKANEYLENIAKEGDVSWLGNLDFSVLTVKNYELNFTKVGELKILLLRHGKIIDIDRKLKFEEIEPYPLKVFGNIVSGKLAEDDTLLVFSKEVYETFLKEKLLEKIAAIFPFDQKALKEALKEKQEQVSKISGICLLLALNKEVATPKKEMILEKKKLKVFSLKAIFSPLLSKIRKPRIPSFSFKFRLPTFKVPSIKKPSMPKISLPKPKMPGIKKPQFKKPGLKMPEINLPKLFLNRNMRLIVILIFFLLIGFLIFNRSANQTLKSYQIQLDQVKEKVTLAETYLMLAENNPQAEKESISLLKEAWSGISPLEKVSSSFSQSMSDEFANLKKTISEHLEKSSNLEEIQDPELIFEFKRDGYIPQRIVSLKNDIYFFSPYSENIYTLDRNLNGSLLAIDKKINLAISLPSSILFFSKPDQLVILRDGVLQSPISLELPYQDFNPNSLSSFQGNIYFLGSITKKIIKYPYSGSDQWGSPQTWLEDAADLKSMAANGSVWAMTKENSLKRYYAGLLQETLNLDVFPAPKDFSKIFTSPYHYYLYILEPAQKRIVITDTSGKVIKQIRSDEFDNLLDFAVSENGRTIYLLNGLKVYRASF